MTDRAPRVLMLVGKDVGQDARVLRCARSLATRGYSVIIVCKSSDGGSPSAWDDVGFDVVSLPIRLPGSKAEVTRRVLREVHRERRRLVASLRGRQGSAGERARLTELRREEAALRHRYEKLAGRMRNPIQLDKSYRAAWAGVLRSEAPDIVHVHDHHGLGAALSLKGATRVIYDAHELETGKDVKRERRVAIRTYLRKHVSKTDAVVTVGSALAGLLVDDLGLTSTPSVVHNTPSRHAKPAPYALRDEVGLDRATPLLVYAGGFNRRRRLLTPIRALADLPDVHLAVILVRGKGRSELTAAAGEVGVGDRVHFPPFVPPECVVNLIEAADVGIHPLEGSPNAEIALPNKLFEYLHAGLPMVVSDCEEMAGFVTEHGLGEVAPTDDPRAWAEAIRRVLADPAAYNAGRDVRNELIEEWCWETQERTLVDLYRRLLGPKDAAWYDEVYATSDEYRKPYRQSMYYSCWEAVAELLLADEPASVLELGCGPGQFAALLRDRGARGYVGIDFSPVAIELARKACPETDFRVEDVRTSRSLEAGSYDAVVCLETLEHLEDDRQLIRRLEPGTRFIGSVPNFTAKAHVRYFHSEREVLERYAGLLERLRVERVELGGERALFVFVGVRAHLASHARARLRTRLAMLVQRLETLILRIS